MGKFSLTGHFPILEFRLMKGPMIFLKSGDRNIEVRKANRQQGKYFVIKDGVFELDGEYAYNLSGQTCLFYNLYNSKPIYLQGVEKVQELYRSKKADILVRELERINSAIEASSEKKFVDPINAMKELYTKKPEELSQNDQKFLIDSRTFDKDDLKLFNTAKMQSKNVNLGMSGKLPTILPILMLMGIAIGGILLMRSFNPLNLISFGGG